jgi:hypothetical protein
VAFQAAPPLKQSVVEQVFTDVLRRIDRQLARLLGDPDEEPRDKLSQRDPAFAALLRNAMLGNQSSGKNVGKPQRVEFGNGPPEIKPNGRNCCTEKAIRCMPIPPWLRRHARRWRSCASTCAARPLRRTGWNRWMLRPSGYR